MDGAAIFIKPPSALTSISPTVGLNGYQDIICETEMALLIRGCIPRRLSTTSRDQLLGAIGGVALAFDLTRKDLQNELKSQGKPWELAKSFDDACPISQFISVDGRELDEPLRVQLFLNGELQLDQSTDQMILPVSDLLRTITRDISLFPGDIVLTGTPTLPKQPPRLRRGDRLTACLGDIIKIDSEVI
jgi:2-keto-4-pentenoate hydratase/2-oxohepta-3-ene-1,7-dioic acid hydratase in catechol pathway